MNTSSGLNASLVGVRHIAHGFLFGIGLCIALAGAYYISQSSTKARSALTEDGGYEVSKLNAANEIVLSDVKEQKNDGLVSIIGKITNSGKKRESSLHLQVNFFNHGAFVDQYSTYLAGALEPGTSQYFKISCGCKDTPPAEHDSYKVEIIRGY
jgi:hypothetical protein